MDLLSKIVLEVDLLILNVGIFHIILLVPHNVVMDLNNVMQPLVNNFLFYYDNYYLSGMQSCAGSPN